MFELEATGILAGEGVVTGRNGGVAGGTIDPPEKSACCIRGDAVGG